MRLPSPAAARAVATPALLLPALALAPFAAPRPVHAQQPTTAQLVAITDKVFAPWNSTHTPGCGVGIARGGVTLLERGYGMANLTGGRPIMPSTILESGSVAKQFTTTAVMLPVADGKLKLDDDARQYLPELRSYGRMITVRHLLTHTTGLREWSNLVAWQGWPRGTRVHTQSDVFKIITDQQALNYPVGDHYSYTNSGFLLARTLVERVSGMDFETFTTTRIFKPLGLTNTSWRGDHTRVVAGLAQAYRRAPDGWHIDMPNDNVIAAGGLWTTIGDWLKWNEHLTKRSHPTAPRSPTPATSAASVGCAWSHWRRARSSRSPVVCTANCRGATVGSPRCAPAPVRRHRSSCTTPRRGSARSWRSARKGSGPTTSWSSPSCAASRPTSPAAARSCTRGSTGPTRHEASSSGCTVARPTSGR